MKERGKGGKVLFGMYRVKQGGNGAWGDLLLRGGHDLSISPSKIMWVADFHWKVRCDGLFFFFLFFLCNFILLEWVFLGFVKCFDSSEYGPVH